MSLGDASYDARKRSLAFRNWFADSKVVDARGRPLLVYHGTDAAEDFESFELTEDVGFHFAATPEGANARLLDALEIDRKRSKKTGRYARWRGDWAKEPARAAAATGRPVRIIPAYLSIQNPLELPDLHTWGSRDVISALLDAGFDEDRLVKALVEDDDYENGDLDELLTFGIVDNSNFILALEREGYDGVRYRNETEGGWAWIALEPGQIKSPFAKHFDPQSRDFLDGLRRS